MAADAQDVEEELANQLRAAGVPEQQIAASLGPVQTQQPSDFSDVSGGFFSPPQRFRDLSNSQRPGQRSLLDPSPPFSPGRSFNPAQQEAAVRTALAQGANDSPYFDTDANAELAAMDPAILARLQDRMAALGINVGSGGVPDGPTIKGFRDLLALANARGEKWNYTLAFYEKAKADGSLGALPGTEQGGPSAGYIAPDYRTVGLEVRNRFRQALGRDPTEGELRLFSDELMAGASAKARQEAAATVAQQEQPLSGPDIGTPDLVSADEVGAHGPINEPQQGDPLSRFEEMFAQKVSDEETLLRRSDEESQSADLARSNIERSAGGA